MMRARGLAAQGARPLAAATCCMRRRVSRPRPARAAPWILGCDGVDGGDSVSWDQKKGCLSSSFPSSVLEPKG